MLDFFLLPLALEPTRFYLPLSRLLLIVKGLGNSLDQSNKVFRKVLCPIRILFANKGQDFYLPIQVL